MKKGGLYNILGPIAVTLGILLVLEVVSRLVLLQIYDRSFDSKLIEARKYGTTDGLRANATGRVWGKSFHTDEVGGRRIVKRSPGHPRLLIMGDSVTEGVGVDDQSTFANLLSFAFSDAYRDPVTGISMQLETRNISLIGWSVTDYAQVVDKIIAERTDSSIHELYLFYCLNDIYGSTSSAQLPPIANKGIISSINAFFQDKYATYKLVKLRVYQHSSHYYQYDKALYLDQNRVMAVVDQLARIERMCKAQNIAFHVFLLPYRSQLEKPKENLPQQTMAYHLGMNGIAFSDLLPAMAKAGKPDELYLFADEIHLSAAGHSAVAKAVQEAMAGTKSLHGL